jgi:hypothetical protein
MLKFAILAIAVLFAPTVHAGKRGLCWTYCEFTSNDELRHTLLTITGQSMDRCKLTSILH